MTSNHWYLCKEDSTELYLHIQPGAKKNEVVGFIDDRLKIKIKASPQEGKANTALLVFLSELSGLSRSRIILKRGDTSRKKTVVLSGSDPSIPSKICSAIDL